MPLPLQMIRITQVMTVLIRMGERWTHLMTVLTFSVIFQVSWAPADHDHTLDHVHVRGGQELDPGVEDKGDTVTDEAVYHLPVNEDGGGTAVHLTMNLTGLNTGREMVVRLKLSAKQKNL